MQDKSANEDLEATVLFASLCQTMWSVHATSRHGPFLVVIEQENEVTGPKTQERCFEKPRSREKSFANGSRVNYQLFMRDT